ncbi:hypothetical protein [Aeromonas jandaei]|uniref:hypothetical protein n=1 Tax=Aeromonas jandaei TaxID=650 RepID=UPI002AA0CB00|nr:hypothetical protein [Aeromonas jandaei]
MKYISAENQNHQIYISHTSKIYLFATTPIENRAVFNMVEFILFFDARSRSGCTAASQMLLDGNTDLRRNRGDDEACDYMIREAVRLADERNNPVCNGNPC